MLTVNNNPVKYVDPSGHDLMIVGGGPGADPRDWEGWIRAYKQWGHDEQGDAAWSDFTTGWLRSSNQAAYLAGYQIQFLNWSAVDSGTNRAATTGDLNRISAVLDEELQGESDNVLLGHSRGGKVIEWYLGAYSQRTAKIDAAILIEGSTSLISEGLTSRCCIAKP
jgi:pimeloyl-ACP methyl ester carboxylesterase